MPSEIRTWLETIGFAAYGEAFERSDIDLELAADLGEDDLKELGVSSLGHRKRLLQAIATLKTPYSDPDRHISNARSTVPVRRLMTVMFCDLAESTNLSAQLDPEDYRELIRAYQDACASVVMRYEGFVARYLGDGVLAYFGWPDGHEDDAERAVRAGLGVIEAIAALPREPALSPLKVRVGLATGSTIVGDIIGQGASEQAAATGLTPNLAARLQSVAPPNSVVISAATRDLVRDLFHYESLGLQMLKGIEGQVEPWRVTGLGAADSRFEAIRGKALMPMIGRDHELGLLQAHWTNVRNGEGRAVLIAGEAGIGKSRLLEAFIQRVGAQAAAVRRYQCSPYETNSAFTPIIRQIEREASFAPEDSADVRAQKLANLLGGIEGVGPLEVALLANLLMLPIARAGAPDLSPQQIKQQTLEALGRQALAGGEVLLILEDAHWIDPSSLEFLQLIVSRIAGRRALLVVTQRPEWVAPFLGQPHVEQIHLGRLSRTQVGQVVGAIAGRDIPAATVEAIVARADGIPLFAEEVTRVVLEEDLTGTMMVPETLQASLTARLDRLPPAPKELAQIASVIGRDVQLPLLKAVASVEPQELKWQLQNLLDSQLMLEGEEGLIIFRHALIRDAAYQSMLGRQRRAIHQRIAATLVASFPQIAEAQPELVARHFAEAGEPRTAVGYWRRAAERATAILASREAVDHYRSGLGQLALLAAGADRDREELQLTLGMGVPLIAATGYGSNEVRHAYARARDLSQQVGDTDCLFTATRGLWNCIYDQAELDQALDLALSLTALAGPNRGKQALAFRALGSTEMNRLAYDRAIAAFDQCIVAAESDADAVTVDQQAEAPGIVALQYKGLVRCLQGHPDEGLAFGNEAVARARDLRYPLQLAFALHVRSAAASLSREHQIAVDSAKETFAIATEHGLVFWIAGSKITRGCASAQLHRSRDSLEMALEGLGEWRATAAKLYVPTWSALIADAALLLGEVEMAEAMVAEAMKVATANRDFLSLPDLQRLEGEIALHRSEREVGEARLEAAIATANQQGAPLFGVQAAARLGTLLIDDGRHEQARRFLETASDNLPPRASFPALNQVRQILDGLGASRPAS